MWTAPVQRLSRMNSARRRRMLAALRRRHGLGFERLEERAMLSLEPVSIADALLFSRSGDGQSQLRQEAASISADGQLVVFQSTANDLVPNDYNRASNCACALSDIFLFNRATGQTSLVSVNMAGTASGDGTSFNPKISADGRYVLFESNATLTPLSNGGINVYLRDLQTATTILVSASASGTTAGNSTSQNAAISADGRFVAFESYANNLVVGDTNDRRDIFVRDLLAGTTTLVSSVLGGTASGNGESYDPRVSDDGRFVAFTSTSSNLVANDGTNLEDIFVRDLQTGVTELISIDSSGVNQSTSHNSLSPGRALSADGRYVLFETRATNLFPVRDGVNVFVRDRQSGTTTAVSVESSGALAVGGAGGAMTPDGRFIGFVSAAADVVAGVTDANATVDVYLRDMQTGITRLVSANARGSGTGDRASGTGQYPFDFSAGPPAITPDGRFVAFASEASNLVTGQVDANDGRLEAFGTHRRDVFVRDMLSSATTLVSIDRNGTATGENGSFTPAISADGQIVAFESLANNLISGQDNLGYLDVFVRNRTAAQTQLASHRSELLPEERLRMGPNEFDAATPDGRFVSFRSSGVVYVRDRLTGQTTLESAYPDGTPQPVTNAPSHLSDDGRFLVFSSGANLASVGPGNTTSQNQMWLRDRETRQTRIVSLNAAGQASAGGVWEIALSQDGRYVAFSSEATDLVAGFEDGNGNNFGLRDVYIRDLVNGVTRLVSHQPDSDRRSGNSPSYSPVFSANGRKLIFQSRATDLVAGVNDANADEDIFVYDLESRTLELASRNAAGTDAGNRGSASPLISGDGRYVVFVSGASDLTPSATLNINNIYRRDLVTGTTVLVSVNKDGLQSNSGSSFSPSMSADGRYIAFTSNSNDLVPGDTGQQDVFVRDMETGQTKRVSQSSTDGQANGHSSTPVLSPDGHLVSFTSEATNLVANFVDANNPFNSDLFVRDLVNNITDLASVNYSGTASGNSSASAGNAARPQFSNDGSSLFFTALPSDLISGDRNFTNDVFAYHFTGAGQIRGHLFNDANKSAGQDAGERDIPFWTVYIDANANGGLDANERNVQTDSQGNFAFTGLTMGGYSVSLLLPGGYAQTLPGASSSLSVTLASATDVVSGVIFGATHAQADLTVAYVAAPTTAAIGRNITVTWSVHNTGSGAAVGDWQDAVYLSRDESLGPGDTLVAVVPHSGLLAAGATYTASSTIRVAAQEEGGYRFIVQTDRRRQIVTENNLANNLSASDPIALLIPQLTVGEPHTDQFFSAGQTHYYQFTVAPGKSLVLDLDSEAGTGVTELLLRRGELPTAWEYDFSSRVTDADQSIYVPVTQGGTYYVLAKSRLGPAATAAYTLTAALPGLKLDSVATNVGSNQGRVTVKLQGTGFTPQTAVSLVSATNIIDALSIDYRNPTLLYATFDLRGTSLGAYGVRIRDLGRSDTQNNAFQIVDEASGELDVQLELLTPNQVRVPTGSFGGGDFDARPLVIVTYANNSKVDVPAPIMHLQTDIGKLSIESHTVTDANGGLQFLGATTDGPAGYLRPGAKGRIEARFEYNTVVVGSATATVTLSSSSSSFGEGKSGITLNWSQMKSAARPPSIPQDAWDPVWDNFTASVGNTSDQLQQVLTNNASYLGRFGEDVTDIDRLLGFEIQQADAALPVPLLATHTDLVYPAAQVDLSFGRAFLQPISGRYRLGPLGRGWAHDWEVKAVTFSSGDGVPPGYRIESPTGSRYFYAHVGETAGHLQTSWTAAPGDSGELTQVADGIVIREPDGSVTAFRSDGKIAYREAAHGVRVTAGYDAGGRLVSLTHSSGPAIAIAYNQQARISQVTDPSGWTTDYTYDAAGEHLLSATDPRGTTAYSYIGGQGPAREHALASISHPGGTHDYFTYDQRGRLIRQEQDGAANAISYNYPASGVVTMTDANNATIKLMVNSAGQLEEIRDALGRLSDFQYDDQHHLATYVTPAGNEWHYGYDSAHHLSRIVDPRGQSTFFGYEPTQVIGAVGAGNGGLPSVKLGAYRLAKIVDARGNLTQLEHDNSGDLRAIVYPNRTRETFSYDPLGNLTESVNRRGNPIEYSNDSRGLLLRKTYADGTHLDYTYNARGSLLTAQDAQGVTSLEYDAADRLTRISYPAGLFLAFTYDAGGRRTSSVDQDGFKVAYEYDATGRLIGLRDGTGAMIVAYAYDNTGRLTQKTLGNDTYTTFTYDAAGQLLSLANHAPDGTTHSRFDYVYDAEGRRISMTTEAGTTQYFYDIAGQLTSALLPDGQAIEYQYDEAGNLGGTPGSRDSFGRFLAKGFNSLNQNPAYVYDADGNLLNKGVGSNISYEYDDENRLVTSNGPDGHWQYEYDALGQRTAAVHEGQRTQYVIDPFGFGNVVAELGIFGVTARYVHGLGLISRIGANGAASYYDFDGLGNTVALTSQVGAIINRYSYLPFGQTTTIAAAVPNPFQFVGEYGVMTAGGGLNFMRARFYDSASGQFVSEDPIHVLGGDGNLRRYVGNNPVNFVDPEGLREMSRTDVENAATTAAATAGRVAGEVIKNLKLDPSDHLLDIYEALSNGGTAKSLNTNGEFSRYTNAMLDKLEKFAKQTSRIRGAGRLAGRLGGALGAAQIGMQIPNAMGLAEQLGRGFKPAGKLGEELGKLIAPYLNNPLGRTLIGLIGLFSSFDPNDIKGPAGYGSQHFVGVTRPLEYMITFENDPRNASAPAQEVFVNQQLDADLDWNTFELLSFGFGSVSVAVPSGVQSYQKRVDYQNQDGSQLLVDMSAFFDPASGLIRWAFRSVDPLTGRLPTGVFDGFLPVNDETRRGEGFVTYFVQPKGNLSTGSRIDSQAEIIFDGNPPIHTPAIFNTIDAGRPQTTVQALPAALLTKDTTIRLNWTGTDDTGGSGVGRYALFMSQDDAPFAPLAVGLNATSYQISGQRGHKYAFMVLAEDNVSQLESKTVADAATVVLGPPWQNSVEPLDVNSDGNIVPLDLLLVINELNTHGVSNMFTGALPLPPTKLEFQKPAFDVNGDNFVTALDALLIINYLNARGTSGEAQSANLRMPPEHEAAPVGSPPMISMVDSLNLLAVDIATLQEEQRRRRGS